MMLDNREIATTIIILSCLMFAIYKKEVRHSIVPVLKSFSQLKLVLTFVLMFLYILFFVWLFHKANLWDWSLLKDTIFWTFGTAFVMFINYDKVSGNLKKTLLDTFKLVIVLEFIAGLYTFGIIKELFLIISIVILSLFSAVAGTKKEFGTVKKIFDIPLVTIGLYLVFHAISQITKNPEAFFTIYNLKTFLLPITFTLTYLPFIYVIALIAEYEMLFVRLEHIWFKNNESLIKYAKKQAFLACRISLKKVKNLSAKSAFVFMDIKDKSSVQKAMKEI